MRMQNLLPVLRICVVCSLSAVGACSNEDYFPLREGLEWEYQKGSSRFTTRVDGSHEIEGKTYYRVISSLSGSGAMFLRSSGDSVFIRGSLAEMLYLGPLVVGSNWQATDPYGDIETGVVEARESVSAGGKTYTNCLRVNREIEGLRRSVEHYCEGVGLVTHSEGDIQLVRFSAGQH